MNSVESCYGGLPGNSFFGDNLQYWVPPDPSINHLRWSGVQVPNTGTTTRVISTSAHGNFMQVHVNK
jgi:immune inhibitor A